MVPYGEFSSVVLLSSPRNYVLCPDEFKHTGPLAIVGGLEQSLELYHLYPSMFVLSKYCVVIICDEKL